MNISSTYSSNDTVVKSKYWFRLTPRRRLQNSSQPEDLSEDSEFEDLSEDSEFAGRVNQTDRKEDRLRRRSTLTIADLRESDGSEYRFTFKTNTSEWGRDFPGTTLTVVTGMLNTN